MQQLTAKITFILLLSIFLCSGCSDEMEPITPVPENPVIPEANTWWNDQVFYEIFVRSFYDSNGDGIGDFQGIIQKLDYLNDGDPLTNTDLGITALWLMPIFPSPSYHGYDVSNYRETNPDYGSINDFKQLLSEAHKRGIKVIIDMVINHSSEQHPWFVNSSSSSTSEFRNWYVWSPTLPTFKGPWGQNVWHGKSQNYYYGLFWSGMPDLNFRNEAVTKEFKDIMRYWYRDIGVDGYRLDAAGFLIEEGSQQDYTKSTLDWWRSFYSYQKNLDPGLMTVGEIWTSTNTVAQFSDQRMDYCFEFDLAQSIINAVRNANASGLTQKMDEINNTYKANQFGSFLTNHDQNRVIEELGLDYNASKVAAGILLSLPGVPYLYYGEEIGMRGKKPDEDIRLPMQWNNGLNAGFTSGKAWRNLNSNSSTINVKEMQKDTNSLWHHYQKFIKKRLNSEALKKGKYIAVRNNQTAVFSFIRKSEKETILLLHNLGSNVVKDINMATAPGALSPGTYTTTELFSNKTFPDLTLLSDGTVNNFQFSHDLAAKATYMIKLTAN